MKRIVMDFSLTGIKTALMYNRELIEIMVDNYENTSIVGRLYLGTVEKVIPNQFAFINIGRKKNVFLQIENKQQKNEKSKLKQGQQILVQILKDENGDKGAFGTTEISLTGKYVVIIKDKEEGKSVGVSQKIVNEKTRNTLKDEVLKVLQSGYHVIIRTNAQDADINEILNEVNQMKNNLDTLIEKSDYMKAPALLYGESEVGNILKALLGSDKDIDEIVFNSQEKQSEIEDCMKSYYIDNFPKLTFYDDAVDILDNYGAMEQITKALNEKVWLKSGGFLLIEETKTCTVIDVNTGKFVNKKNRDKLVLQNNYEAAKEVAKQIRLRNLSGMILVDFVDLYLQEERDLLLNYFKNELKKDRIVGKIVDYSALNIVQLTRKKTRMSLSYMLTSKCPLCDGTGQIPNIEYICDNIYKKLINILSQTIFNTITISSNERIINYLSKMDRFMELKSTYNAEISLCTINTGKLDYYEIEKEKR